MTTIRSLTRLGLWSLLVALIALLGLPAYAEDEAPDEPAAEEAPDEEQEAEPEAEAVEVPWVHDVLEAKKQAAAEGKDLFINFTGSDWCGWCHKLEGEVFGHAEFLDTATKHFVFVFLDFPRDEALKAKVIDAELSDELKSAYGVGGFPTIILTTAEGHPYARTGYQEGGPAPYLEMLTEKRAAGDKIKALLADAKHEDAEALKVAFPILAEAQFLGYPEYTWTLDAAEKLDPEGELELLPLVVAERERMLAEAETEGLVAMLPKEEGETPEFVKIANFLIEHKRITGRIVLDIGLGVTNWLLEEGKNPQLAKSLMERVQLDPLAQNHPNAKRVVERFVERVEEALNPPADEPEDGDPEDGDPEDDDPEDGDDPMGDE